MGGNVTELLDTIRGGSVLQLTVSRGGEGSDGQDSRDSFEDEEEEEEEEEEEDRNSFSASSSSSDRQPRTWGIGQHLLQAALQDPLSPSAAASARAHCTADRGALVSVGVAAAGEQQDPLGDCGPSTRVAADSTGAG